MRHMHRTCLIGVETAHILGCDENTLNSLPKFGIVPSNYAINNTMGRFLSVVYLQYKRAPPVIIQISIMMLVLFEQKT